MNPGWLLWFTGLSGCGKSTIARMVTARLQALGHGVHYLEMDQRRKIYFPSPKYSPEERLAAYTLFAEEGARLSFLGYGVILDGAAPSPAMRNHARTLVPAFAEIHVKCSLPTAMHREASRPAGKVMADLYRKALDRQQTGRQYPGLGQVIGVDVPYEENLRAECTVNTDTLSPEQSTALVLDFFSAWRQRTLSAGG